MGEPKPDEVGVTVADLTPVTPETAEERRIQLEAEIIREEWRERERRDE